MARKPLKEWNMDMGAKSQEENWPNTLQILVVEPAEGPGRANV